jgi:hypothetical protein
VAAVKWSLERFAGHFYDGFLTNIAISSDRNKINVAGKGTGAIFDIDVTDTVPSI